MKEINNYDHILEAKSFYEKNEKCPFCESPVTAYQSYVFPSFFAAMSGLTSVPSFIIFVALFNGLSLFHIFTIMGLLIISLICFGIYKGFEGDGIYLCLTCNKKFQSEHQLEVEANELEEIEKNFKEGPEANLDKEMYKGVSTEKEPTLSFLQIFICTIIVMIIFTFLIAKDIL